MPANISAFERSLTGVYIIATPSPGEGTIELLGGGGVGDRVEIADSDTDSDSIGTPMSIDERGKTEVLELLATSATTSNGVLPKGLLRLLRNVNELADTLLLGSASSDMDLR